MQTFRCTDHAEIRCRQRGIRSSDIALFMQYADKEFPARAGCVRLACSKRVRQDMVRRGCPPQTVDRVVRLTAITNEAVIVTVYHDR